MASNAAWSGWTVNGIEYSTEATTRPAKENVIVCPVTSTQMPPISDFGLRNTSR
jgi:hypothetical protein